MLGDGCSHRMPDPPLNRDRVEVAPALFHPGDGAESIVLERNRFDDRMHDRKTKPACARNIHKARVLEFRYDPRSNPLRVKPLLERPSHAHVLAREKRGSVIERFGEIAPEFCRDSRYGAKGDAGTAEPVIEGLRFETA